MATVEHSTMTSAQVHEPKHITDAGTGDAGQVITPSAAVAGTSVIRRLVESEINDKQEFFTLHYVSIQNASTEYIVMPFDGIVTRVDIVVPEDLAGSNTVFTVSINGVNVDPATITLATGQGAGYSQSVQPTTQRTFSQGDTLEIASDGGTSTATHALVTITTQRANT